MTKNQLRKHFLSLRKQLLQSQVQQQSHTIAQTFFDYFDLQKVHCIHLFLPILRHHEVNTWIIIDKIWHCWTSIALAVSRSDLSAGDMESYIFTPHTQIVKNQWDIPEPLDAVRCSEKRIDMVLVPLLCFDERGFRVGYGKGFYDRFFTKCRPDVIKIGLSFFDPVKQIVDVNAHDVKMDFCIVQERVFNFS